MQQDLFIKNIVNKKIFQNNIKVSHFANLQVIQPFKLKSLKLFGIAGTPYFP